MHLTWTSYTEEYATELGLTLDDVQAILTSPTAFRERVSGPIYAYVDQGIRVTIDTHTCTVLRVEYDLDPDALDDWYFTPDALDDCKRLKTTPAAVVDSIDDAQPYPAPSMCTIYRGVYDVLANEPKTKSFPSNLPEPLPAPTSKAFAASQEEHPPAPCQPAPPSC